METAAYILVTIWGVIVFAQLFNERLKPGLILTMTGIGFLLMTFGIIGLILAK